MDKNKITVLGAGMVGLCCAISLQQRGLQVQLIDRRGPGEETSSGNAGIFSLGSIAPLASPALLPRLPRFAANLDTDFLLHYSHLPRLLPWLIRFLARCNRNTYLADGCLINALTQASVAAHLEMIKTSQAVHLVSARGGLRLYRKLSTYRRDELERELFDRSGVNYSVLNKQDIHGLEPDLAEIFVKAVFIRDSISIKDPQALCRCYAKYFQSLGGEIRQAEVTSLRYESEQWRMQSSNRLEPVERLVICLGAWTPGLIKPLGYSNPVAIERGYHTLFSAQSGRSLSRPVFDVDSGYVMIPMNMGYRVTSGSNLIYRETRATPRQIEKIIPCVREAFPVDEILLDKPWMGHRSSTPDSLPLIGPAPRHKNLWLAFAHAHMGFTMGPISGQIIANYVTAESQPMPVEAYLPSRYF